MGPRATRRKTGFALTASPGRLIEESPPVACPLCGSSGDRFQIVGERVYGGRPEQHFYECPSCDVAFLYPRLTEEEEARFYAAEFEAFMDRRAGGESGWSGPEAHIAANQGHVVRRMGHLGALVAPGLRVLEFGCSSGFMLLALRAAGAEVAGIEPSGGFSAHVRSLGIPVFDSLDSFRRAPTTNDGLDLIVHFFVIEHIRDPITFLRESLDLLKPGGQIFFEVPSRDDPLLTVYDVPAFQDFYWSVAHHWYFNRRSLEYLCRRVGAEFDLLPEQRYDLSNHMTWARDGRPGGSGRWAAEFTPELNAAYLDSMRRTGHCDTYFVHLKKAGS